MVIIKLSCPYCSSKDVVRNSHAPNGKQKYRCLACKRQTRDNPTEHGYSEKEKDVILKAYQERSSLRGLKRTFGVERNTVIKKRQQKRKTCKTTRRYDYGARRIMVVRL